MKNAESFLKPLSQGIYKTNQCQKNARNIGYCVIKFCNIRRVGIVFLTPLGGRSDRPPKARHYCLSHFLSDYIFEVEAQPVYQTKQPQIMCLQNIQEYLGNIFRIINQKMHQGKTRYLIKSHIACIYIEHWPQQVNSTKATA